MRKTTLFLIGLAFALLAAACGSSDSETLSATGGNGDQTVETPTSPAPDDESKEAPATPTSTNEAAEGGQTAEDDQAGATPDPDDQIVEGPASPAPEDEAGESGTSSSSEADEDDRTSSDASSASSSEDQTEDGPEDDAGSTGADTSSGSSSSSEDHTDGTPSPDSAVSVSSDQVGATTPTPSPTPVVPESDRRPVTVEDVQIVVRESWPMQVAVLISGALPTPCHELKWTVEQSATTTQDDWTVAANGSVHTISVWTTELPSDMACATVMEPFSEQVELGRFVSGDYTIVVNGERFPVTL